MKKLIASLLFVLLAGGSALSISNHSMQRAFELYVPVQCINADGSLASYGSSFPVDTHVLFTARHMLCDDGETMHVLVKDQDIVVQEENQIPNLDVDLLALYVPEVAFSNPAQFRAAEIGEDTAGFSRGNIGEAFSKGFVMQNNNGIVMSSQPGWSGSSGSAMVGDDGKVIGMIVDGVGVCCFGDLPAEVLTGAISGTVLDEMFISFKDEVLPDLSR